jgi:hypothetical protein
MQHYHEIEWQLADLAIDFTRRGWFADVYTDRKTGLPCLFVRGPGFVFKLKTPEKWRKRALK